MQIREVELLYVMIFAFVQRIKSICAPAFYSAPTPRQSPSPIVFPRAE